MMGKLPPGWESDYDGQRWFYTYKPTGNVQYHFPSEGDEFPDFVDASLPAPGLAPEERLESTKQLRRQGSQRRTAPNKQKHGLQIGSSSDRNRAKSHASDDLDVSGGKGYVMSATARPLSDVWEDDDNGKNGEEEGEIFQPESLMYLGPGSYKDVSPLVEEDQEDEAARRVVVGGIGGTTNGISPLASETTTPMVGKSELSQESTGDNAGGITVPLMKGDQETTSGTYTQGTLIEVASGEVVAVPSENKDTAPISFLEMEAPVEPPTEATANGETVAFLDGREVPQELPGDDTASGIDPVGTVAEMETEQTPQSAAERAPIEIGSSDSVMPTQQMPNVEEVTELDASKTTPAAAGTSTKGASLAITTSFPVVGQSGPGQRPSDYQPYVPALHKGAEQMTQQSRGWYDSWTSADTSLQRETSLLMGQNSGSPPSMTPAPSPLISFSDQESLRKEAEGLAHAPSVLKPAGRREPHGVSSAPLARGSTQKRISRKSLPSSSQYQFPSSHPTVLRPSGKSSTSATRIQGHPGATPAYHSLPTPQPDSNDGLEKTLAYSLSPNLSQSPIIRDSPGHGRSFSSNDASPQQHPMPAQLNPYSQLLERASSPQTESSIGFRRSSEPAQMQQHQQQSMGHGHHHGVLKAPTEEPESSTPGSDSQPCLQRSQTVHEMQGASGIGPVAHNNLLAITRNGEKSHIAPSINGISSVSEISDAQSTTSDSSPQTSQSAGPPVDVNVPQRPRPSYAISQQNQALLEEQYRSSANVSSSVSGSPISPAMPQQQLGQRITMPIPQPAGVLQRSQSVVSQPASLSAEAVVKEKDKGKKWTKWFRSSPKPQVAAEKGPIAGPSPPVPLGSPAGMVPQQGIMSQQGINPRQGMALQQQPVSPQTGIPPQQIPGPQSANLQRPLQPQNGQQISNSHWQPHLQNGPAPLAWPQQNFQPQNGRTQQLQPFIPPYQPIQSPTSQLTNGPPMPQVPITAGLVATVEKPYPVPLSQPTAGQRPLGPQPWQQPLGHQPWQQPYQLVHRQQGPPLMMPTSALGVPNTTQPVQSTPPTPVPPNPPAPMEGPNVLRKKGPPQSQPLIPVPRGPPSHMGSQHHLPLQQHAVARHSGMPYPQPSGTTTYPAPFLPRAPDPRYPVHSQGPPYQGNANIGRGVWPGQPVYANTQQ